MFKLTAHDMKSALVIEKLENHGSQTTSFKRVKVVNNKPTVTPSKVPTGIKIPGTNPNGNPITVPSTIQISVIKKGIKPVEPPQKVAASHLKDPISTTTNLDEACPLDTSCDHLLHLNSPSLSSELQDNSSVDSVEIELNPESEGQWIMSTFHKQMFSQHTMNMNCSYYKRSLMHQMTISSIMTFITGKIKMISSSMPPTLVTTLHYPNSWHNTTVKTRIALMIQVQYQPLPKPHVIIPSNLSVLITHWISQCNQSQHLTLMKNNGVHSPSASQASQTDLSSSLVSQYPPDPGEHVLKRCAASTCEQDIPVQWFKFIHLSPKPRMTKTTFQIVVQMAYSPIASMNYKWTINLHDGYPLFRVIKSEGYITPSLHLLKHNLSSSTKRGDEKFFQLD